MRKHILHQITSPCTLRRILKKAIFGNRIHCPHCKSRNIRSIKKEERWRCRKCLSPLSIKSSSWLKGSKLELETIWLLLWCWQKKINRQQAMELSGVSYPTVLRWYEMFREHIPKERLEILLKDEVAADEMFTKNTAIMGAKQKGTRNIALKVLHHKNPSKAHAIEFLTQFVKAYSTLHTDGSSIYKGIGNWHKLVHKYEVHSKFEFSLTAEIEEVWAVFRTFVRRMYHHVTMYKLESYVAEFCLRFRQDEFFDSPQNYWSICLSEKPFGL